MRECIHIDCYVTYFPTLPENADFLGKHNLCTYQFGGNNFFKIQSKDVFLYNEQMIRRSLHWNVDGNESRILFNL